MTWNVWQEDVIRWAESYRGERFHALLCDAPYELKFMNKSWDATGISFRKETWEAYYRILLPGAFGMSFGGARTAHRIAVALEDAGFVIHPTIAWIQGQGFPKSARIDTRIDQEAGAEREVVGKKSDGSGRRNIKNAEKGYRPNSYSSDYDVTAPPTDLAKAWAGHRYGLQALKPALEPIIVFQKPYEGKPLESMVKYGAGALNIDGSRIGDEEVINNRWKDDSHPFGGGAGNEFVTEYVHGRWPANFVLSHLPDCTAESCTKDCAVRKMSEQKGILTSGKPMGEKHAENNIYGRYGVGLPVTGYGDSGSAARFFFNADWMYERWEEEDGFWYESKASHEERDAGLRDFDKQPILIANTGMDNNPKTGKPVVDIPRANHHPAVKPIALIEYLATLLLPPAMYAPRRIVVPFAGSGSEMIGCMRAGWEVIEGIELEAEYCKLARARLTYWQSQGVQKRIPGL